MSSLAPFTLARPGEVWTNMKARLSSAGILDLLRGPHVYQTSDDYSDPEGLARQDWGRLVIAPADTLWPEASNAPNETRQVSCLVRAEVNKPAPTYNPAFKLEAIQAEVFVLLRGWCPAPFTHVMVALPFYQWMPPQLVPQWDPDRKVWWTSSHWRAEIAPAPTP